MKNKKMVLLPIGLLLIVLIGGIVRFVLPQQTENIITTQLYFLNESDTTIVPEIQKIHYDTAYDIPRQVIAALQKEPQNKKYHPVLGMDTELLQLQVENGTVVCDFSKEFLAPERGSVILSVYAVIKTLCQLEGVRAVKVLADGMPIIAPDGNEVGFLSDQDINLADDSASAEAKDVILYFAAKDKMHLVKEQRTIRITDKQPAEQYIVNALIQGPENKDALAVLASDTTLVSAQTTDGTCFVNFKSDFVDKNTGTPEKEALAVYAIVNALTELETVRNVQFLIDGKKVEKFGSISIRECVYRKDEMIEK